MFQITLTDKLALLPLVKRQVFCVGDRFPNNTKRLKIANYKKSLKKYK